jgi:hypothetical protein
MNFTLPKAHIRCPWDGMMGRAALLVPGALALWWFLLKPASLWLLRVVAYVPLGLLVAPAGLDPVRVDPATGEWTFNVVVNTTVRNPQTGERQMIDSTEFAVGEDSVAFFSCGWFSYLALAFSAAGFSRSQIKPVLKGVALQTCINVLALAAYVYINGYGPMINTPGSSDSRMWLIRYCYHIIYLVVPFAGPFAVALLAHREWREYAGLSVPEAVVRRKTGRGH